MRDLKSEPVVEVDNISKLYSRVPGGSRRRMASALWQAVWGRPAPVQALHEKEFWALRNISLTVARGEALGIIGLNGAGKTTLLRHVSGQMLPDCGEIRIHGTSASMIDLTAGFQQQLSGRENIRLRLALLGRERSEIERLTPDIIEFTELDADAIDAPLSTYSSGMKMRVAFATSVFVDPDLFIVDEILSVGDFRFRQKCLQRVREMRERCAFILVSHSMNDIQRFCDQVVVLEAGQVVFRGAPSDAISFYEDLGQESIPVKKSKTERDEPEAAQDYGAHANPRSLDVASSEGSPRFRPFTGPRSHNESAVQDIEHYWVDQRGHRTGEVSWNEPLVLRCEFRLLFPPKRLSVGIPIWTVDGELVTSLSSVLTGLKIGYAPGKLCQIEVRIPKARLAPNQYVSVVAIVDGLEFLYRQPNADLTVRSDARFGKGYGNVIVDQQWRVLNMNEGESWEIEQL